MNKTVIKRNGPIYYDTTKLISKRDKLLFRPVIYQEPAGGAFRMGYGRINMFFDEDCCNDDTETNIMIYDERFKKMVNAESFKFISEKHYLNCMEIYYRQEKE